MDQNNKETEKISSSGVDTLSLSSLYELFAKAATGICIILTSAVICILLSQPTCKR